MNGEIDRENPANMEQALSLAFERVGEYDFTKSDIDFISSELKEEFPNIEERKIFKALRNGGFGNYGRTYKMCTTTVCFWIREYIMDEKIKELLN